jgi:hypothetical protein
MKKTMLSMVSVLLAVSVVYAATTYTTNSGHFASGSKEYFAQAVSMLADGDTQTVQNMIVLNKIFILQPGLSVYIVKQKRSGSVKIRFKGTDIEVWTLSEAIE